MANRKMPSRIDLGRSFASTMAHPMNRWKEAAQKPEEFNPHGLRTVMGFNLPRWQRGLVWTDKQKIAFIESAWKGIPLGTYSYNEVDIGSPLDNLLIDGQQRMSSLQDYLNDRFPVFGWHWSQVTDVDRRSFSMTVVFGSYVTASTDEEYLKGYYDLLNFGGTAHTDDQRATR